MIPSECELIKQQGCGSLNFLRKTCKSSAETIALPGVYLYSKTTACSVEQTHFAGCRPWLLFEEAVNDALLETHFCVGKAARAERGKFSYVDITTLKFAQKKRSLTAPGAYTVINLCVLFIENGQIFRSEPVFRTKPISQGAYLVVRA